MGKRSPKAVRPVVRPYIGVFNFYDPQIGQYARTLRVLMLRFFRTTRPGLNAEYETNRVMGLLAAGDPNILCLVAVIPDRLVAYGVVEVREIDGELIAVATQIWSSSGKQSTVDIMFECAHNWVRSMNIRKFRADTVLPLPVVQRWAKRFGYRIIHTVIEKDV